MKRVARVAGVFLSVLGALSASAAPAASPSTDAYAWRLFISLNQVAGGDDRSPWERWASSGDTFLASGEDPGPWEHLPLVPRERFETLPTGAPMRHIVHGRMVPMDPLASVDRLVEVRLNRLSYEFIRTHALYRVDGQLRAVAEGAVEFPVGAIQLKASWRPIGQHERFRYHTLLVPVRSGRPRLFGLTALNLAAKTPSGWVWASFEHRDNRTRGVGWDQPSRDALACPGGSDCDKSPAAFGIETSVWRFYRLRGTQTTFVDGQGDPVRLGNSELESGLKDSASCMTCHARASIGLARGAVSHLPVFASSRNGEPRGYVGAPDPGWFSGPDGRPAFRPLDFVWSLAQAAPGSAGAQSAGAPP